jgi:hypothetical protein
MRRRTGITMLALALCVAASAIGCSTTPSAPKGFPPDFPLPAGRMYVQPTYPDANTVEFTIEAVDSVSQCSAKLEQKLAGTKWKRTTPGEKLFDRSDMADVAVLTDGVYEVTVVVNDLGNTTKAGFRARKL